MSDSRVDSGIHTAECTDFMAAKMGEDIVDLVVTSPPYDDLRDYKGFTFDCEAVAKGLHRVVKKGGVVVWVVGDRINGGRTLTSFEHAFIFRNAGFTVHDAMIFKKRNTPFMRKRAYTNCYEFMFVFSKGVPTTFNPLRSPSVRSGLAQVPYLKGADGVNRKTEGLLNEHKVRTNIWSYGVGKNGTTGDMYAFKHPAMFPEKLARDQILSWSNEGDLVFDPMCGAGTTCKMAKATGRRWLGVDISREYVAIAKRRVKEAGDSSDLSVPSRSDPFEEITLVEEKSEKNCSWCGNAIPIARVHATGGRAVTCSKQCSLFRNKRRRVELKEADRAKQQQPNCES